PSGCVSDQDPSLPLAQLVKLDTLVRCNGLRAGGSIPPVDDCGKSLIVNREGHGCTCTGSFGALLIVDRSPLRSRVCYLLSHNIAAQHADDLGVVVVAD